MHYKNCRIPFFLLLMIVALSVNYCNKSNSVVTPPSVTELQGIYSGLLSGTNTLDTTTYIFTFVTDTVTLRHAVGQDTTVQFNGIFALDTAVSPNQITIHITHSTIYPVGLNDSAIFNLSVNVLKISANAPGTARPSAFDSTYSLSILSQ
jgi:hypothetical protein